MHPTTHNEQAHISSLVIHCLPEQMEQILSDVRQMDNVEVHVPDVSGKFVALLETENEQGILATIDQIQSLAGVLTATMVYHEIDDGIE